MKKYLPVFLFLIGIVVIVGVFLATKSRGKKNDKSLTGEVTKLLDIPLAGRPLTSLIPKSDGHWLKLKIEKIDIAQAKSLDYELLYNLPDGRTQGVPGTIILNGQKEIERDILLGSESSGKFRYDQGVEAGTLTLKFRDDRGRLLTKFSTDFHLQSGKPKLTSVDAKFAYSLDKSAGKTFFVTMETFGIPGDLEADASLGPIGIFASTSGTFSGKADLGADKVSTWVNGKPQSLEAGISSNIGIFVSTSE